MNSFKSALLRKLLVSLVMLTFTSAYADDTEVFYSPGDAEDAANNSNVLFIMDNSGSMNQTVPGSSSSGGADKTRLQVMQNALSSVLTSAPSNLNIGIINYGDIKSSSSPPVIPLGGPIILPPGGGAANCAPVVTLPGGLGMLSISGSNTSTTPDIPSSDPIIRQN